MTNFVDALREFFKVRASPIDLTAAGTAPEIGIVNLGERLQAVDYNVLLEILQQSVARPTT